MTQRCKTCTKKGTNECPFDCELSNRDGCDNTAIFRRDVRILTLDEIANLCGLQCHSSDAPAAPAMEPTDNGAFPFPDPVKHGKLYSDEDIQKIKQAEREQVLTPLREIKQYDVI